MRYTLSEKRSVFQLNRRRFLGYTAGALAVRSSFNLSPLTAQAQGAALPIAEAHFPSRLHLFVWRNWELANTERMAEVVKTTAENILEIGHSMGLPEKPHLTEDQLRRIYITAIRQNLHILPVDQIIDLLGWDQERFEFTLRDDDFLDHKLGRLKPQPQPLTYSPPSAASQQRAAEIGEEIEKNFGSSFEVQGESPFAFVEELSRIEYPEYRQVSGNSSEDEIDLRGWKLIPLSELSQAGTLAIDQFREYLNQTFRANIEMGSTGSSEKRSVSIQLTADRSEISETYEIRVSADSVKVLATDPAGLRHGLYRLEDLMESRGGPVLRIGTERGVRRLSPAYLYSYFALYGDPLLEEEIDPFPEGYLQKLARRGVNGVWLQGILRNLAPSSIFPEFGTDWKKRLNRLNELVDRAHLYGIRIYLYMNEPRGMPQEFFGRYPEIKGAQERNDGNIFAMCTSVPMVREWVRTSLAHVFREVPDLGGIFTISMSENLTNCFSKGGAESCPRCSQREGWEVVTELHEAFVEGVKGTRKTADVIAWDWGWGFDWVRQGVDAEQVIKHLPAEVKLLSVSEWDVPVNRGGFETEVGEYSMSAPGPGPRAKRHWSIGRQQGIAPMAKVQLNSTWEISAVPYIPVAHLVQRHMEDLLKTGITGIMLSWTVGGYPSPNLEIAKEYYVWPTPDGDDILFRVAMRRYGDRAAPRILNAWHRFSDAFEHFPYGIQIYVIPTQHGPANLLRLTETGYPSGMILFPYDDWKSWVRPYPPTTVQSQFQRMASEWNAGLTDFREAIRMIPDSRKEEAEKDFGVAETCYIHFQSVANQLAFYLLREQLLQGVNRSELVDRMTPLVEDEIELARRLYLIARRDSRIGYEASNHYYYRPLDLAEKALNCLHILRGLRQQA